MSKINGTAVIGLTGQSGAGKTTVCKVFAENGFAVINADNIAREIMENSSPCLKEVEECFGESVILPDGTLDRAALGDMVFGSKDKLAQLNAICNPYITHEILNKINQYAASGESFVLIDAPTLFESRADDFCDLIISVTATEKMRTARLMERDGKTPEQIKRRFSSQHTEKFFVTHSDIIIKNNKSAENLIEKAREVAEKVKEYCNNAEEAW